MRFTASHSPGLAAAAATLLLVLGCQTDRAISPEASDGAPGLSASVTAAATGPRVLVTEIMADPAAVTDAVGEWFELFNAGDAPADLAGWKIVSGPTGSEQHTIAALTIPAGGYAVLTRVADPATNGGITPSYVYGTGITFNNSNTDWLRLEDATGVVMDSVAYVDRSAATLPSYSAPTGASRAVVDIDADRSVVAGSNWSTSTEPYGAGDRGTPGTGPYVVGVPAGPVVTVTVTPSPASVAVGSTVALTAAGTDADGRASPTTFAWTSSNETVATVDVGSGVVTGVAVGTATVTATAANGVIGTSMVTVAAPSTAGVVFITEVMPDPAAVLDDVGEWFELFNTSDAPADLTGWRIVSGPSGAETHTITSLVIPARGFAVLTRNGDPAVNGGITPSYVYGTGITLNNGNTDWLALRDLDGVTRDSVAYVDRTLTPLPSGPFTAGRSRAAIDLALDRSVIAGSNWETATEVYGAGDRGTPGTGPYGPVTPAGPVVTVALSPSPAAVILGGTRTLAAIGRDADGRSSPTTFTWSSANPLVAEVTPAGVVSGVSEGSTVVTATAANGVAGTATVNVGPPNAPALITISVNNPRQAPVGYTKPAFPTVRDADNVVVSPPPALVWTSSDPSVATVDARGYITGVSPGSVTISAAAPNGVTGTVGFTVIPGDAPTSAVYRNHVEFGVPIRTSGPSGILLDKAQFISSYSTVRGAPAWVSWNLNATQFGPAPRCDCFSADLALPAAARIVDFDYRNGGYDRGHLVQSESRTTTDQENAATFLLTNIIPQAANTNQGPWLRFENFLNDQARSLGREVYVVAGGEYSNSPETLKNEGRVQVPDYSWKVAIVVDGGAGLASVTSTRDLEVYAIRMPNDTASARTIRNEPWETFATTVDAVEAAVGYDVFHLLPDSIERIVESGTRAPVAVITGPDTATVNVAVIFDGTSSSDPDGDAIIYAWTFGDGATATGATPTHRYTTAGTFTVRLVVTDAFGATGVATRPVTVRRLSAAIGAIIADIEALRETGALYAPNADALIATLRAAQRQADTNPTAAFNQLGATLNQIRVFARVGRLAAEDEARLRPAVERVRAALAR